MNAPDRAQESYVSYFRLDQLQDSPTNPRNDLGDLTELAASIGRMGVLQPILIRPHPDLDDAHDDRYEIISGHRRAAAARLAGLVEVPCRLCEGICDEQACEIQIVENLQRADLTPLEEAIGYRRLQEEYSQSVDDIAERVGKSRAYVYAKLKLMALHEAGRAALAAGQISESVALLVARIPGEKLQAKAVKTLTEEDYRRDASRESMAYRQAQGVIRQHFSTNLRDAIWKLDDDSVIPDAGSCQACPQRSGNNREEYADIDDERVCMNPECYALKREATLKALMAKAEKQGKVVPAKEAQGAITYYGDGIRESSGFVNLRAKPHGLDRTWERLAKDHDIPVKREVIIDKSKGKTFVVARGEQLKEALIAKGVQLNLSRDDDSLDDDDEDSYHLQWEAHKAANIALARESIAELLDSPTAWTALARSLLSTHAAAQAEIIDVAGLPELAGYASGWQEGARAIAEGTNGDIAQLRRLVMAVALIMYARPSDAEGDEADPEDVFRFDSPEFDRALAEIGIDAPARRAELLAKPAETPPAPSDAAQAENKADEPVAPAPKSKRARKSKPASPAPSEGQIEAGSAGVENEGACA
jgi:ParB/RepB/Spo0J family partition protein